MMSKCKEEIVQFLSDEVSAKVLLLSESEQESLSESIENHVKEILESKEQQFFSVDLASKSGIASHVLDTTKSSVVLFTHYERLGYSKNLWISEKLYRWRDVKIIIICRDTFLSTIKDIEAFFSPFAMECRQSHLLCLSASVDLVCDRLVATAEKTGSILPEQEQLSVFNLLTSHAINQHLYVNDLVKLSLWADSIVSGAAAGRKLEALYRHIVFYSKKNASLQNAASNALSILVKAGVLLCDQDFDDIEAPDADIRGGYFDRSTLNRANLVRAKGSMVSFGGVVAHDIRMNAMTFAEKPFFKYHAMIKSMIFRDDLDLIIFSVKSSLYVWRFKSRELIATLTEHHKDITKIALNRVGDTLVSVGADNQVIIWDLNSLSVRHVIPEYSELYYFRHREWIFACDITRDGKIVASADASGAIRTWDAQTGDLEGMFIHHDEGVFEVSFRPDGKLLVSVGWDQTLRVHDVRTRETLYSFQPYQEDRISKAHFHWDLNVLVTVSISNVVRIWRFDPRLDELDISLLVEIANEGNIQSAIVTHDESKVIVGSGNGFNIFDLSTRARVATVKGHAMGLGMLSLSQDDRFLMAVETIGDAARVWDLHALVDSKALTGHLSGVRTVAKKPDTEEVYSFGYDNTLRVWRYGHDFILMVFEGKPDDCVIDFSLNQALIGDFDGNLNFISLETGEIVRVLHAHKDWLSSICSSADKKLLVTGGNDRSLKIWETTDYNCLTFLKGKEEYADRVRKVVVTSDNQFVIWSIDSGVIYVFNVLESHLVHTLEGHNSAVHALCLSHDDRFLISGSVGNVIRIWDLKRGEEVLKLCGHADGIAGLYMCRDSMTLVSFGFDAFVNFWDIPSGKVVHRLALVSDIQSMEVSSDGAEFVVGLSDGVIQRWASKTNNVRGKDFYMTWSSARMNRVLNFKNADFGPHFDVSNDVKLLVEQQSQESLVKNEEPEADDEVKVPTQWRIIENSDDETQEEDSVEQESEEYEFQPQGDIEGVQAFVEWGLGLVAHFGDVDLSNQLGEVDEEDKYFQNF